MRRCADRSHPLSTAPAIILIGCFLASCSTLVFQPSPVVPTKDPLPYSAKVTLSQVEAYMVKPGATMIADPRLENHVTGVSSSLGSAKKEWEQSIVEYLAARRTFARLSTDAQSDLELALRLNVYIDPGVLFQFSHVYIARIDATLVNPRTGRPANYLGFGKSAGDVVRGGKEDDRGPINLAVQSALNDLFGKIEGDSRLR